MISRCRRQNALFNPPRDAEQLDGRNCQVWRYGPKTSAETGLGNVLGADQASSAFGVLEQAEIKLWVCEDGAVHQLMIDLVAHNPKTSAEKGTVNVLLHFWDLDATIQIDAPVGAKSFQPRKP